MSFLYQEMKNGKSLQEFSQKIKKNRSVLLSPKNVKKVLEEMEEVVTLSESLDQSKKLKLIDLVEKMEDSINENMNMNEDSDSEEEVEVEKTIIDSDIMEESEEENEDFSQKDKNKRKMTKDREGDEKRLRKDETDKGYYTTHHQNEKKALSRQSSLVESQSDLSNNEGVLVRTPFRFCSLRDSNGLADVSKIKQVMYPTSAETRLVIGDRIFSSKDEKQRFEISFLKNNFFKKE